jgi:hypothetical protein
VLVANRPIRFSIARWLRSPSVTDTFFIVASLTGFLLLIAVLGVLGFGVGFEIGPIGEDYNWIDMLQRGPGAQAARLLWALDYRNPLSPWWYIAGRKLILNFDAGLLVLRYAIAVVLAFSSYILVRAVAGPRARPFAVALAVLVTFWMANRYTDQIIWNFQGALAASMLSVAAYAGFITKGRRSYHLYALSLILWFLAFATYTIQCGAAVAIGYLAFRQALSQSGENLLDPRASMVQRLLRAALDIAPYVILFGFFILIWQTTMGPLADAIPLKFDAAALLRSLKEGVWNNDFAIFFDRLYASPHLVVFIAAGLACGGALFLALQLREARSADRVPGATWSTLIDVLIVFACLALPTIVLEASSDMWGPGTRWPMIYQVTTPVWVLGILAAVLLGLRAIWGVRLWKKAVAVLWNAGVGLAVAIGAVFSLGQNWVQNAIASNETFIRENMERLVAENLALGRAAPSQVLLMLDKPNRLWWRSSDTLSPTMARVWFRGLDASFRLVPWPPMTGPWASWWQIRFGSDGEGVGNAKVWGGTVPYQDIAILYVSGHTARRVTQVDRQDLSDFDVEWARDQPVSWPSIPAAGLCPLVWTVDHGGIMDGWSAAERDDKGPMRWTITKEAHLSLPASCAGRARLRVVAAYAVSKHNSESVNLKVNGQPIAYRRASSDGNIVYEAELDPRIVSASPLLKLEIGVDELDTVPGATRRFGIAVRRVEVLPADVRR